MSDESDDRSLKYEPSVSRDRLTQGNQSGFKALNPTLAEQPAAGPGLKPGTVELFVHGNSKVTAQVGPGDASSGFKLLRLRRQWTGQLAQSREAEEATGYVLEPGPKSSRFQWHFGEDCHTDGPWIDTPGERHILVQDKRGEKRSIITSYVKRFANGYRALQEFIVGVGMGMKDWAPVASFGGLYFIMAADIRATEYRVLMSQPRDLTDKELLGAMGDPSKPFPLNIIPKDAPPDFASFPGQAESSGWRDYRGNAR